MAQTPAATAGSGCLHREKVFSIHHPTYFVMAVSNSSRHLRRLWPQKRPTDPQINIVNENKITFEGT